MVYTVITVFKDNLMKINVYVKINLIIVIDIHNVLNVNKIQYLVMKL